MPLVAGVQWQADVVRESLAAQFNDVLVHGMLAFYAAERPWIGKPQKIDGVFGEREGDRAGDQPKRIIGVCQTRGAHKDALGGVASVLVSSRDAVRTPLVSVGAASAAKAHACPRSLCGRYPTRSTTIQCRLLHGPAVPSPST